MRLFSLERSRAAYYADFLLYGAAVMVLAAFLLMDSPHGRLPGVVVFAFLGLGGWTLIEYALHRFVLHGLQPFRRWHAEHHGRPTALICTPTILSATLIAALSFFPALEFGNLWGACALTLGLLTGYFAYGVTHHATHHWRTDNPWLKQCKTWHALHHHDVEQPRCFGVTTTFWDRVFGTARLSHRKSIDKGRAASGWRRLIHQWRL
jgi:cyclopropane-fatty-acyl-phospholipid synthase